MKYKHSNKNWEGLADRDMLWSILTDPSKKNNQWELADFFQSGQEEVDIIFNYLEQNNLFPKTTNSALDFGCGVGRLSRAISNYFSKTIGVDVSSTMVEQAKLLNDDIAQKTEFIVNEAIDLKCINPSSMDMVFTMIVLQHIPSNVSLKFIASFLDKLKPGGRLVFQIPVADIRQPSPIQKLKSNLRIRERLALIGIGKGFHMHMHVTPEDKIDSTIKNSGGIILHKAYTNQTDPAYNGKVVFCKAEECHDYLSRFYVVSKEI